MPKTKTTCAMCGRAIERYRSQLRPMNFCSRACMGKAVSTGVLVKDTAKTSAHMTALNRALNPTRMDFSTRCKLRTSQLGKGAQTGYAKRFGKHEHVIVAETCIGRKLRPDEVVHHIDRNKRNNSPANLVVLTRSQHSALHRRCENAKEVMSDEFQAVSVSAARCAVDC